MDITLKDTRGNASAMDVDPKTFGGIQDIYGEDSAANQLVIPWSTYVASPNFSHLFQDQVVPHASVIHEEVRLSLPGSNVSSYYVVDDDRNVLRWEAGKKRKLVLPDGLKDGEVVELHDLWQIYVIGSYMKLGQWKVQDGLKLYYAGDSIWQADCVVQKDDFPIKYPWLIEEIQRAKAQLDGKVFCCFIDYTLQLLKDTLRFTVEIGRDLNRAASYLENRLSSERSEDFLRTVRAISSDRGKVVSGSDDQSVIVWDKQTTQLLEELKGHDAHVFIDQLTSSWIDMRECVLTAAHDGMVKMCDVRTNTCVATVGCCLSAVLCIEYDDSTGILAAAGRDTVANIWDIRAGRQMQKLLGHTKWIRSIRMTSSDGLPCTSAFRNVIFRKTWSTEIQRPLGIYVIGSYMKLGQWKVQDGLKLYYAGDSIWQADCVVQKDDFPIKYPWLIEMPWLCAGVAVPMFFVRSEANLGVGEFLDLKILVDWAVELGFHLVQLLPINDTSVHGMWWDSYPYRKKFKERKHSWMGSLKAASVDLRNF
ncbi:hypothetical protein RHGRI_023866 [Rhododendron griersonianum]|uniref:4-alpha-glucanotransferase n=1 Tax=Rhododendron griersonianum TaxID=479676 RepID=A0AAV6JAF8_9ERIC|nr:hypothetical protein RHGRI_023866 [Rhododendron griersonianum]